MQNKTDYLPAKPDAVNYFRHNGVVVERLIGGFRWYGKLYLSIAELEADPDFIRKSTQNRKKMRTLMEILDLTNEPNIIEQNFVKNTWGGGEGAESAEEMEDESLGATETNF